MGAAVRTGRMEARLAGLLQDPVTIMINRSAAPPEARESHRELHVGLRLSVMRPLPPSEIISARQRTG